MHIHLDPVGGVAGDMFIAAMLDAFPQLADALLSAIRVAGLPSDIACRLSVHRDAVLAGTRFSVGDAVVLKTHDDQHHHVAFREIRESLERSGLKKEVRERAVGIFSLLAEAEARVHGMSVHEVTFHELGGWDSIADIVGAAYLIDATGARSWSIGVLPKGAGHVHTAHGDLPVPTPATAVLLEGYELHDDGRLGERVTPTGAAIIRHLGCAQSPVHQLGKLMLSGHGFGTKAFPGISNVLRVLVFEGERAAAWEAGSVALLEFEVDDQTPEDLALGLGRLRDLCGVLDVMQLSAIGKKGRMAVKVQVLAQPEKLDDAIRACLAETTTLGLRYQIVHRAVLRRQELVAEIGTRAVKAKVAARAGGIETVKAESDDIGRHAGDRFDREALRDAVHEKIIGGRKT